PPPAPARRRARWPLGLHPLALFTLLALAVVFGMIKTSAPQGGSSRAGLGLVRPRVAGEPGEPAIQRGNGLFRSGDVAAARAEYATAISIEPDFAVGYYNRGLTYRAEGEYAKSIPDFSKALALEPGYNKVYYYRGEAYVLSGQPQPALADLATAADRDAEALFALYLRAAAHHELEMNEAAINDLRAAADRYSGLPLGYFSLGLSSKIHGERVEALEYFRLFLDQTNGYTALESLSRDYILQLQKD
ncbi:MAG TPA: tetratricopeptide repeat protein, partial [Herpetosiphonaceae bacterium]